MTKPEVRAIAAGAGLAVAGKAESQDLCFLAGEGKRAFLARHARRPGRRGEIVDRAGRVLGTHPGYRDFTVGQRRGLGVAAGDSLYVLATDPDANRVVAGRREELATHRVRVSGAVLHRDGARVDRVRLRYHSGAIPCRLTPRPAGEHAELTIELAEPAYGVAPGQIACLMDGDVVVGQGTIV
jgi:tRNA-specific 2-thiouridylase